MIEITKESLIKIGFKRYGWDLVGAANDDTGIQIVYNTKINYTEVRCMNDSIPVDNCKSTKDITDLIRLFNINNKV